MSAARKPFMVPIKYPLSVTFDAFIIICMASGAESSAGEERESSSSIFLFKFLIKELLSTASVSLCGERTHDQAAELGPIFALISIFKKRVVSVCEDSNRRAVSR